MERPGRRRLAAIANGGHCRVRPPPGRARPANIHTLPAHRAVSTQHIQQRSGRVLDAKEDAIGAVSVSVRHTVAVVGAVHPAPRRCASSLLKPANPTQEAPP